MKYESYDQETVQLLQSLIRIPALSRSEHERCAFLQQWLLERGIQTQRVENNLWAIAGTYDSSKPSLLLNSHMDTVKPVNGWNSDPFTPVIQSDSLFGLGSNDAGASLTCLIQAFRILSTKEQAYNLVLGISAEEEITGKNGIEALLPALPPIQLGLIGEPTQMHPAVAEKGLMVLDCTVRGKAGHAARNEGENAIYKALKSIEWFQHKQFPLQSDFLGPVKMTVTQIQSGTQHNVIPDNCQFVVDVRINEFYSPESLFQEIRSQVDAEVNARSFRLNSSRIPMEHPIIQTCISLGRIPYGSPTLSDQARMPFTTFKMGPGASERSHTANEFIHLSELSEGLQLYVTILDGLRFA